MTLLCCSYGLNAQADCATALPVTVVAGCNDYTNTAAFPGTASAEACEPGASQGGTDDAIWYSFVAPFDGVFDVTSTMSTGAPDTDLAITDACGAAACIGQNDDGGTDFTSTAIGTPMVGGATYFIQWGDDWGGAPIEWAIRAIPDSGAPTIAVGAVAETTAEITPDGASCAGAATVQYGAPGFAFGTGTAVMGTTITGLTPGTTYDVCISCVAAPTPLCGWTGNDVPESEEVVVCEQFTTTTPCPDPTTLVCTTGAAPGELDVTWVSDPLHTSSTIEYGPVGFTPGAGTVVTGVTSPYPITGLTCGDYDVYVSGVCDAGPSLPVGPSTCTTLPDDGTACPTCVPLTLTPAAATCAAGGVYPATFTFVAPDLACGAASAATGEGCWAAGATNAGWYCFTPACDMVATLTSTNDPAETDTRLALYSGTCAALVCEANDDDGGAAGFTSEIASFSFTAGTDYIIEWDDRWSSAGFTWDVIVESEDAACAMPLCIPTAGQWGLICLTITFLTLGLVWMREEQTVLVTE